MKKFLNLLVLGLCVFGLTACGEVGPEGPKGDPGIPGEPGQDGIGIESISLTDSEGNVDTYTITYSDGSTSTFTVTNGEDGSQGIQGEPGQDGHTPTISISNDGYWVIDGVKTDIKAKGEDGQDGRGIESITLTNTEGNVDTYTITYSDGTTSTFTVTNGEDGSQGIQGEPGQDGHTPVITISSDGYWVIDGVKTDTKAQGQDGEDGNSVLTGNGIPSNEIGKDNDSYIDLDTFNFYVKENGVWKLKGNIKGQDGNDGIDGKGIESITLTSSEGNVDTYTITYTDGSTSTFTVTNGTSSEEKTYNITFDLNGGQFLSDYDESNYVDILKGDCVNLPIPHRYLYVFEGWYTGKSINDTQFSNSTPVNSDVTLIAKWAYYVDLEEIRRQRTLVAADTYSNFYSYFEEYFDVIPSEYIDTLNTYIGEINFASSMDELFEIQNNFIQWLHNDLIVLDQMLETLKTDLTTSWNNFLNQMSELSSSEYQQRYDDLLLEIGNSENINIGQYNDLNSQISDFILEVQDYIYNNTLDENMQQSYLEEANLYHNDFVIIFNNVIDPVTSENYYNDEFTYHSQQISNATNNVDLYLYYDEMISTYNYLINDRFYGDYDYEQRTSVVNSVAQNIYDYINNEYQSLKSQYGDNIYNEYIDISLSQLLSYATEANYSTDLNNLYSMYKQLIYELDLFTSVNIDITFNCPYDVLMMNGTQYERTTITLGNPLDITEFVNRYQDEGFVVESVTLDGQTFANYYELEGRYYIDINSENGFEPNIRYDLDFKYSISDYSIAQPIIEQYVDDSIQTLTQQASSVGVDISIYQEYIDAIYETSANIIDETTYQNYVDACNELMFVVSKDSYILTAQNTYNELLEKYPELLEDSSFLTYNTYYQNILLGMQNSTAIEELNTYVNQFSQLYYEVLSYAEYTYGIRN